MIDNQLDRRKFFGIATMGVVFSGALQARPQSVDGGRVQRNALSTLENYMRTHCRDWGLPGMTACLVDESGFTGFVHTGLADLDKSIPMGPQHLFQIGSLTKSITSLTVWSLIDEGKLAPDLRLAEIMPEIAVRGGEEITLQQLMNHNSGLPGSAPIFVDGGLWVGSKPGSYWSYSNLGYEILGKVVERVDERSFSDSLKARIFDPLGMSETVAPIRKVDQARYAQGYEPALFDRPHLRAGPMYQAPWVDYDLGSGCVAATAGDMAIFLRYLIALSGGRGEPVFSDETARRFMSATADAAGWAAGARYGNGLACVTVKGRDYRHHTGGMLSFSSSLHVDLEAGVACFASTNVNGDHNYRPRDVTHYGCELLRSLKEGVAFPEATPSKPVIKCPPTYVGVFSAQNGDHFEVVEHNDGLAAVRDGYRFKITPVGDHNFACSHSMFELAGIDFDVADGAAIRAWVGGIEFLANPSLGFKKASTQRRLFEGFYANDDVWDLPSRVFMRGEKMCMKSGNNIFYLKQSKNGDWRSDQDQYSAERVRFDHPIDGRYQRLNISGRILMRRFA
ncbi:MAG: serine hydrolase domain-containing protein [Parvibaculaceae bacterium]